MYGSITLSLTLSNCFTTIASANSSTWVTADNRHLADRTSADRSLGPDIEFLEEDISEHSFSIAAPRKLEN